MSDKQTSTALIEQNSASGPFRDDTLYLLRESAPTAENRFPVQCWFQGSDSPYTRRLTTKVYSGISQMHLVNCVMVDPATPSHNLSASAGQVAGNTAEKQFLLQGRTKLLLPSLGTDVTSDSGLLERAGFDTSKHNSSEPLALDAYVVITAGPSGSERHSQLWNHYDARLDIYSAHPHPENVYTRQSYNHVNVSESPPTFAQPHGSNSTRIIFAPTDAMPYSQFRHVTGRSKTYDPGEPAWKSAPQVLSLQARNCKTVYEKEDQGPGASPQIAWCRAGKNYQILQPLDNTKSTISVNEAAPGQVTELSDDDDDT